MRRICFVFCLQVACTDPPPSTTSVDAAVSDVLTDALVDAVSDTVADSGTTDVTADAGGCPFIADGSIAGLPPFQCCCDGLGTYVSAVCVAGAWKCAFADSGYKTGTDLCNPCPVDADVPPIDVDAADVLQPDSGDAALLETDGGGGLRQRQSVRLRDRV